MLQAVCSQVNRNWISGDKIVRTTDRFWLPGCDLMKNVYTYSNFKDIASGLCEETEFSNHLRPSFVNDSMGPDSYSDCWLRSAHPYDSDSVAALAEAFGGAGTYYAYYCGFAPACTIG